MNKNITFKALKEEHFLLLLKWLETPHVKLWWDADINWTPELIEKKYSNYVKGFKRLKLETQIIEKPMHAFIINCDGVDIGYIQYYNKHDFPPEQGYDTSELPESCAAIDWYIGELDYVGKGIGPQALNIFLNEFVFKVSENAFVDPDTANVRAIRVYEKVGFKKIRESNGTILMIKARIPENHAR
ncbi:GNAT family N-acetyltransferase [Wolbachia endosymbiont of Drosophila leontia]|uniref:GNAT family N-acetyltransferase n=1 Tax=Wolbachia endosymbiont of Drosophila leontia TaxID=3002580 RepID=UPI0023A9A3BB|nr:GNAT family N-acetyltransferase [Wolbachia endosymbiont of Drosophila leontia]MDE5066702.1 GNAT family N-acetyltransferase [Wolbachia endosymbiont of Drosophila leontia]